MICCPCHCFRLPWSYQGHQPIWTGNAGKCLSQEKILKTDQPPSCSFSSNQSLAEVPWEKQTLRQSLLAFPLPPDIFGVASFALVLLRIRDHTSDQQAAWLSNCLRTHRIPNQLSHDSSAEDQQLLQLASPGKAVNASNRKRPRGMEPRWLKELSLQALVYG